MTIDAPRQLFQSTPAIPGVPGAIPGAGAQPWTTMATPSFSSLLDPRDGATDRAPQMTNEKAHKAAEQLTSSSLVLPILAQSHKDPFKSDLFHGGQAEDAFQAQLDTILADRITSSSRLPIVDSIYRKIMARAGGTPGTQPGKTPSPQTTGGLNIHG